eukprot:100241-Amorphochlora_amoeboformis.AAC.1
MLMLYHSRKGARAGRWANGRADISRVGYPTHRNPERVSLMLRRALTTARCPPGGLSTTTRRTMSMWSHVEMGPKVFENFPEYFGESCVCFRT